MGNKVASGGSSTINGVAYQLLRSLLHVAQLRIANPLAHVDAESVTIVLEPKAGGDVRLEIDGDCVVEQIKARSDGRAWSLREVIEEVLPDLFLAADTVSSTTITFRFVTEGRMGGWSEVYYGFFKKLRNHSPGVDPLADLDDREPLKFKYDKHAEYSFFPEPCTQRTLFLSISHFIAQRPAIKKLTLNVADLHRRVRFLLGNFEFLGGQDSQFIQRSIDALLLAIVDKESDISRIRDHLAMELARESTVGGAVIVPMRFLSERGLDATPLTDWGSHIERARRLVNRSNNRQRYFSAHDVRLSRLPDPSICGPILVVTGESGTGKSWTLSSLAERATGSLLPILIESEGTAESTLLKCAELFWNNIHNGDEVLPLSRVAHRLQKITQRYVRAGLALLVDGVSNYDEARRLVEQDWEGWSFTLILACRPEHAKSLQAAYPGRIQIYECQDYTWEELHNYLDLRLDTGWTGIPIHVRETLRRPLLAGIYCDQFGQSGWDPLSEYELYQKVWERLSTGPQNDWPLDVPRVEALARMVRNGVSYPWSRSQLQESGVDDAGLIRLLRIGWLVNCAEKIRVFHDRLLQWSIARSLCSDLRDERITAQGLIDFVTEQVRGTAERRQVYLETIPLDVLWILNHDNTPALDVSVRILASLERVHHQYSEVLYAELIPTVGPCVVDAVYSRYCSYEGYPWILKRIADCLVALGADRIDEFARPLIFSDEGKMQRKGVGILRIASCPALLNQLWKVHISAQSDPTFFGEDEDNPWGLYRETFESLERSVVEAPEWLKGAIAQAESATDPVHDLGWLVAGLDDGGVTWRALKRQLFEKTSVSKAQCLASNIAEYRDASESDWLLTLWESEVDCATSGEALRALARVNPDAAVAAMSRMKTMDLRLTRSWALAEVFERRPGATQAAFFTRMSVSDNPWDVALAFENRENDISTEQLEVLLDALSKVIDAKLKSGAVPGDELYMELAFLAKLAAPAHLQTLRTRRCTAFELVLRDYVLKIGPQIGVSRTSLVREPALAILNLIGGEGLTDVANEFLLSDDPDGMSGAIKWASKRPDSTTIERLRAIVQSDVCVRGLVGNQFPVNQDQAMWVLAQHGQWKSVAEGLEKWGRKTSPELKDCPTPVDDHWVDLLRQSVHSTPTPGRVLALGAIGRTDDCRIIHSVLDHCDSNSELAHACIIALDDLGDRTDEGVERVTPYLKIANQRYSASLMLQAAGTPRAWKALFENLRIPFQDHTDFQIAINLINLSEHANAVVEIALAQLTIYRSTDRLALLRLFFAIIRPESIRAQILQDSRIREIIHIASATAEGRYWVAGSKADAIECLAEFAPKTAFDAACQAFVDDKSHDRERYPAILKQTDREGGIAWLIEHYPSEKSRLVRIAIGRTLEDEITTGMVLDGLRQGNKQRRAAVIGLAGWAVLDDAIDDALTEALEDPAPVVNTAAIEAKQRRRDRRTVTELSRLVTLEKETAERSIYLDALIGFTDPGDAHRPLHHTLKKALETVSHFEAKLALDRLTSRRKKLHDRLKSEKVV